MVRKFIFHEKNFELLALLASKPEKVFDRDIILKTVWGDGVVVGDRTIGCTHSESFAKRLVTITLRQLKELDISLLAQNRHQIHQVMI